MAKKKMEFVPAREGDLIFIQVPNYWAKSTTFDKANSYLKELSGSRVFQHESYVILSVHPDATVDEVDGSIYSPKGHRPVVLARSAK